MIKANISKASRIAVLAGGLSSEREVSLRSGNNCLAALQRLGYQHAYLIDAQRNLPQRLQETEPDVVFLTLHGTYGEDGAVQGLLEWMGIPYTGNSLRSSALTMDKSLTKRILRDYDLPVLPWATLKRDAIPEEADLLRLGQEMGYPLMVKPVAQGSSYGMSKVDSANDLLTAVKKGFAYDSELMLEPFFKGRDLTVGAIQVNDALEITPILELRCPKDGWYSLEAKYTHGETVFILPAELNSGLTQEVQEVTRKAHIALGCHGVSRTDFVCNTESGQFYILEVNTIPGMTDLSDLPAQCQAMGMAYDTLVEAILHTASLHNPLPQQEPVTSASKPAATGTSAA